MFLQGGLNLFRGDGDPQAGRLGQGQLAVDQLHQIGALQIRPSLPGSASVRAGTVLPNCCLKRLQGDGPTVDPQQDRGRFGFFLAGGEGGKKQKKAG